MYLNGMDVDDMEVNERRPNDMPTTSAVPAYEGLLYTVFQKLRQVGEPGDAAAKPSGGVAIAFTSANSGEGVTHTVEALLRGLSRDASCRTLVADSRYLRRLTRPAVEVLELCQPLAAAYPGVLFALLDPQDDGRMYVGNHSWEGSWEYRRDVMDQLQLQFDYVVIDCPALRESNDILSLAPFVAGVILIVEASKTRRDQILHAEKSIEFAHGHLLGHVLNKRSYVVPEWLYRRL
jgi:hypothetical protein